MELNGDTLFLTCCVAAILLIWLLCMYLGGPPDAKS